jgi:hypothetical protein
MRVNPASGLFCKVPDMSGYSFLTATNLTEEDRLTVSIEEGVESTLFQFYSLLHGVDEVGYMVAPTRGIVKNFGNFVLISTGRLLKNPVSQSMFDLAYRFDSLRIYRYGSLGALIGCVHLPDCKITEVLQR